MVAQFIRFVGVGGINTATTYILYLLLLYIVDYKIAYTATYIIGIAFAYWLNLKYVFHQQGSTKKVMLYPLVYLVQYLLGIFILYITIEKMGISEMIAPIIVIVATIPLTFILTKKILTGESSE